jgi:hypothetical protein
MANQWTMLGNDSVWLDFKYHQQIFRLWDTLSKRYSNKGKVIAAYDVLNEPETNASMDTDTPGDINRFYRQVISVIRRNDRKHTISLALPRFVNDGKMQEYCKGIDLLNMPDDDNLVLQSHSYMPMEFTHQNVWHKGEFVSYPGLINGVEWNIGKLRDEQKELIAFSKRNPKIPILIGEFSCPIWTGDDGIRYLSDLIQIAEENGWSWAYHAYRENQIWNAELSMDNVLDQARPNAENPRLQLLINSMKKNESRD